MIPVVFLRVGSFESNVLCQSDCECFLCEWLCLCDCPLCEYAGSQHEVPGMHIRLGANLMSWSGCVASMSEYVLQPPQPRLTPVVGDSRLLGAGGMQHFESFFFTIHSGYRFWYLRAPCRGSRTKQDT